MLALQIPGFVVLVAVLVCGLAVLRAGRELDRAEPDGEHASAGARRSIADVVDDSLHRTRIAVEELVLPEADAADLQPSPASVRQRAHTYTVVGTALIGLSVALLLGVLLPSERRPTWTRFATTLP